MSWIAILAFGLSGLLVPAAPKTVWADSLPPFSGTSETTFVLGGLAPAGAATFVGGYRIDSTWSVADPDHWRLDKQTLQPALESGDETLVANGPSLLWYKSIFNRAWRMPLTPSGTLGALGLFQGGSMVGEIEGMGKTYFSRFQQNGGHVRLLRQEQALGRAADVYQVWPLYRGSSASYGRALVWLDQQYPVVLRMELQGLSREREQPHHWVYRVTSLTLGQGTSAEALAYQPPVLATQPPASSSGTASGSAGPGAQWQAPKGFIPAGTPSGYILSGSGESQDPLWGRTSTAEVLFTRGDAFLSIQEQVRVGGLPAALTTGASRRAGSCEVWTGQEAESGLRWLALRRGRVSLLAVAGGLSESSLTQYAAKRICAKSASQDSRAAWT